MSDHPATKARTARRLRRSTSLKAKDRSAQIEAAARELIKRFDDPWNYIHADVALLTAFERLRKLVELQDPT